MKSNNYKWKDSLLKMISSRIEKRIKTYDTKKHGTHVIDIAMHNLGDDIK